MGAITVICIGQDGYTDAKPDASARAQLLWFKERQRITDDDISKLITEGISANSTAFLEETDTGEKPKGVGNPTEVALLLWLNSQGRNYLKLRETHRSSIS